MKTLKILQDVLNLTEVEFYELANNLAKHKILLADGLFQGAGDGPRDTYYGPKIEENNFQKTFSVYLINIGPKKLNLIRFLKNGLCIDLFRIKEIVDSAPILIKEFTDEKSAKDFRNILEEIGAEICIM